MTLNDAAYVGLPEIRGVVVKDIPSDDSPAKAAGIEPGDVIIAVDGKPVEYVGQLQQVIGFRRPGDVVKVEVARKGGVRKTVQRQAAGRSTTRPSSRRRTRRATATRPGAHRRLP